MKKLILEFILIIGATTLLSIVFTYPAIKFFNTAFIGDGGDNYEYAAYMSLAARHITQGEFPYHASTFWRYPSGFDFARGFDSYITVTVGSLLSLLFGIVAAYNATILFLMTLNGICSYIFFRYISRSKLLGVLGMILYGFSFYTIAKAASHPNLLFIGGFPLLALPLSRIVKNRMIETKDIIMIALFLTFTSLGSTQYFILAVFFTLVYFTIIGVFNKSLFKELIKSIDDKKYSIFFTGFFTFLALLFLYFPHIKSVIAGEFILLKRDGTLFELTPSPSDYVLPNSYLKILPAQLATSFSLPSIEKAVFIGWIELFFSALFLTSKTISRSTKKTLLILFALPFVLSLGYGRDNDFFLLPYHFVSGMLPFSALVETGRYVVIFLLIIAIAITMYLQSVTSKTLKTALIAFLMLGMFLERIPTDFHKASTLAQDKYIEIVKKESSKAVLDLPINLYYAPYTLLSFYYNKPIVNGYFHWSADGNREKLFLYENHLDRFICQEHPFPYNPLEDKKRNEEMITTLKKQGITTVVVHKDDKFYHPVCTNVRSELTKLTPPTTVVKPTSQESEQELVMKSTSGKSQFVLYFDRPGTVFIGGVYIAPTEEASFMIKKNESPADFFYSWNTAADHSMQLTPQHTISVEVAAGDTITFFTEDFVESTYFSLWYRYVVEEELTETVPYQAPLEKIYDDEKATVYRIH